MSFAAGIGAGMGAGVGTGIAIGVSSGRQAVLDELGSYLAENGLTIHGRDGEVVSADTLTASLRGSCGTRRSDSKRKVVYVAALLLVLAICGAAMHFIVQQ